MNKSSKNRLRQAQKEARTGQKVSVFARMAPYRAITLTLEKTTPLDTKPKVARRGKRNSYSE